jgi:RimJ/RimL family protein N-acetyltransferase
VTPSVTNVAQVTNGLGAAARTTMRTLDRVNTNQFGQRIGRAVDWTPREAPTPVWIEGKGVRLEPLSPEHAVDLYVSLCRLDSAANWTYLPEEMPRDRDEMAALVDRLRTSAVTFAIVPLETGKAAGYCQLMRPDPAQGSVEIGNINLSRQLQRSRGATEMHYLLMHHVFEDLGYRRYEWKCDSLHDKSRRAAMRLGFIWEGRFRNAVVYKGRNRDTDWFSITVEEWPRVRRALEQWLDDRNFDDHGYQLVRLAARPPKEPAQ